MEATKLLEWLEEVVNEATKSEHHTTGLKYDYSESPEYKEVARLIEWYRAHVDDMNLSWHDLAVENIDLKKKLQQYELCDVISIGGMEMSELRMKSEEEIIQSGVSASFELAEARARLIVAEEHRDKAIDLLLRCVGAIDYYKTNCFKCDGHGETMTNEFDHPPEPCELCRSVIDLLEDIRQVISSLVGNNGLRGGSNV